MGPDCSISISEAFLSCSFAFQVVSLSDLCFCLLSSFFVDEDSNNVDKQEQKEATNACNGSELRFDSPHSEGERGNEITEIQGERRKEDESQRRVSTHW